MIRGFDDQEPTVAESAYVDPAATVIGNVTIHTDAPGERVLLEEHAAVGHNAFEKFYFWTSENSNQFFLP